MPFVGCQRYATLNGMKILILYRPKSEQASNVESFIHDFKQRHEADRMEILDIDKRDGIAAATLYDIMQYPAILALRDDGSVLRSWLGEPLPLMDEVAFYTAS
jgi:hypothetical protein